MAKDSSRGAAWNRMRKNVLERDGWRCMYCGVDLIESTGHKNSATADHIIAKENGGEDRLDNLVAACLECNGRKSDRVLVRQNWVNRLWLDKV